MVVEIAALLAEAAQARDQLVEVLDRRLDVVGHLRQLVEHLDRAPLVLGIDRRLTLARNIGDRSASSRSSSTLTASDISGCLRSCTSMRADAAERREPLGLEQAAMDRVRVAAEQPRLGRPAQHLRELGAHPRLDDVANDQAFVDRTQDRIDIRVRGDDHAHRLRPALLRDAQQLFAAHRGHPHVGHDDRDFFGLEDLERGLRVRRRPSR